MHFIINFVPMYSARPLRELVSKLDYTTVKILSIVDSAKAATTGEVVALAESTKRENYYNMKHGAFQLFQPVEVYRNIGDIVAYQLLNCRLLL